jgi:hypothetical protein
MAIINGRGRVGIRPTSGSGSSYDADALAFFTAASITDSTQMGAVNTLVITLKSNNLWTKMRALYPIVGGNATAHSYNLIDTSKYRGLFSSGWVHSSNGMLSNGSSAYMDTQFNPSNILSVNDAHLSFYLNLSRAGSSGAFGALASNTPSSLMYATPRYFNDCYYSFIGEEGSVVSTSFFSNSETKGFYVNSRTSSTRLTQFKNGVLKNTVTGVNNGTLPNRNMYIGAMNANWGIHYSNDLYTTVSLGIGLSDSESTILSTIINTFNTTLGRNTY